MFQFIFAQAERSEPVEVERARRAALRIHRVLKDEGLWDSRGEVLLSSLFASACAHQGGLNTADPLHEALTEQLHIRVRDALKDFARRSLVLRMLGRFRRPF